MTVFEVDFAVESIGDCTVCAITCAVNSGAVVTSHSHSSLHNYNNYCQIIVVDNTNVPCTRFATLGAMAAVVTNQKVEVRNGSGHLRRLPLTSGHWRRVAEHKPHI